MESLERIVSLIRLIFGSPQVFVVTAETETADFQSAKRFLEGLLESSADRHRFADAFHLRHQRRVGFGKFFESKPGNLGNDIVDRRFKTGFRFSSDVVGQFPQPIPDGEFGGDLGDRKTGGLGSQRTGTTDTRDSFR